MCYVLLQVHEVGIELLNRLRFGCSHLNEHELKLSPPLSKANSSKVTTPQW